MDKRNIKKICIVTAARSEYGLLRWLMKDIASTEGIVPQVIVTGSHLSTDQGYTIKEIEKDAIRIDKTVEMLLSSFSSVGIAKSMGLCAIGIADAFNELKPDILVILGDRYELLPICSTALVMGIPIAHISGGDITEGALDDQVRNAITMMSSLHFPGTEESAQRVMRMLGNNKNVFAVGEPGLDNFKRSALMSRSELADSLNLDINKRWVLLTLHPETTESLEYNLKMADNLKQSLDSLDNIQVVITQSNADLGGNEINAYYRQQARNNPQKYSFFSTLGQVRYLSFMKEVWTVVGNSSSGIVEAPFIAKPVINIGNRQKGRHICTNVINAENSIDSILSAINNLDYLPKSPDSFWGDGHTTERIIQHITNFLCNE